jgi:thiol-disulfide isomerase/thioredoxin
MNRVKCFPTFVLFVICVCLFTKPVSGQARPVVSLFNEIEDYVSVRSRELASAGKRVDAAKRDELEGDRSELAAKYAVEVAARKDLAKGDIYYLGRLYGAAGNEVKLLETMKRFLAEMAPQTTGEMIQSARGIIVVQASQKKDLLPDAEATFDLWRNGTPMNKNQMPTLQNYLAAGYYRAGQYDLAVKHAQEAFDLLKTFKAKTVAEKRSREQIYMNLIEVLAMSYRKSKNSDKALSVLAEARAESFAIPSAGLYRKVMDFVDGSGFSEKKLMQRVESYSSADPAPEMKFKEWIGHDPIALEYFRGRVVLLDFWATWCGPCISTFPRLRSWYKKYGGDDFIIVGVTQYYGQQDGKKMTPLQELDFLNEFRAKYKLPYPFAIAESSEAPMKYGISAYPTTILLDRKGVVRYIGIGSGVEESENLEDMIKKVISEERNLAIGPSDQNEIATLYSPLRVAPQLGDR